MSTAGYQKCKSESCFVLDSLLEGLLDPVNRKESEMRKQHYLRYRRVLEIIKVTLTIVWVLFLIVAKWHTFKI